MKQMAALLLLLLLLSSSFLITETTDVDQEAEALEFLRDYGDRASHLSNKENLASWNYNTNITDFNEKVSLEATEELSNFKAEAIKKAAWFPPENLSNSTRRQLKKVGSHPLDPDEEAELAQILAAMGKIYASSKVCLNGTDHCLNLEPGLSEIMSESTDYDRRTLVWKEWRRVVGRQMKPKYERYVELENKRARRNNHSDYGDDWRSRYEVDDFEGMVQDLYKEVEPLYMQLHAYVRRKLFQIYGKEHIDLEGKLPASLLGDMWGRFWGGLYKHLVPYPDRPSIEPDAELKAQNYTVEKLFRTGDDFYASMGLIRVPESFWTKSMLRKPDDGREVVCHATAWDFSDGKDYRIKMCASDFSFGDLNTIHHELGHVQYSQQYKNQPYSFRDGANDGFHEAIGELMSLAGSTPKHLHQIGLLKELKEDKEQDINFLMSQSLNTISTLPFHLVNDLWRWKVFRGEVPKGEWNSEFWRLMGDKAGVKSPVERTEEDLDPATLFHIVQDFDMIRYFTRTLLQFQFLESLCQISGHSGPLHRCDFSQSKEAGEALAKMLKLGASRPWPDALEQLTGQRTMSAKPILEFFKPLAEWLEEKNKESGDKSGWN